MIELTRLDNSQFYLNPHQIEYIEMKPDTTLVMLSGKRIIVREDVDTLRARILSYRQQIGAFKNEV